MRVALLRGSVEDILPTLGAESFDASLCDPPYGLEFMGKEWDAPWKQGFSSHGYTDTKGRRDAPSYGSKRNPVCLGCHKHRRGADRCMCATPAWDESPASNNQRLQEWFTMWSALLLPALRPGAHLLAFGGTRTFHRLTVGIEDGGFEIRDCLAWLYGSGFPKSLDVSKAIDNRLGEEREIVGPATKGGTGVGNCLGNVTRAPASAPASAFTGYGTALKPAWEPCILAMKPTAGTFAANALAHGVAGLAIDDSRIGWDGPEDAAAAAAAAAAGFASSRARGTAKQSQSIGAESRDGVNRYDPQAIRGRWPANVLLDEEAAGMLDAQSGELTSGKMLAGTARSARSVCYGAMPDTATLQDTVGDSGGASRFFYTAKADRAERQGSKHPTLKPMDLCAYLARLLLPPVRADGKPRRILVPFSGAGSEMIGCLRAGWDEVVGIEREAEYVADAERRIRAEFGLLVEMERAA